MINYTQRLDAALRKAAWAHEQAGQHRKGTDIPYFIHPVAVMMIASNVTDDEDVLIACLMHDILEDVDSNIYSQAEMQLDFGDTVVSIVLDVTKDDDQPDWHKRSNAYLHHLEHQASDQAVVVSAADKLHNLQSILFDYQTVGEALWQRFSTKSSKDQLWWYQSILVVLQKRSAPQWLVQQLTEQINLLKTTLPKNNS